MELLMEVCPPPDKQEVITVATEAKGDALKEKKDKLKARAANKTGYRDLVMSVQVSHSTL